MQPNNKTCGVVSDIVLPSVCCCCRPVAWRRELREEADRIRRKEERRAREEEDRKVRYNKCCDQSFKRVLSRRAVVNG
jgi:hypothetical protein